MFVSSEKYPRYVNLFVLVKLEGGRPKKEKERLRRLKALLTVENSGTPPAHSPQSDDPQLLGKQTLGIFK